MMRAARGLDGRHVLDPGLNPRKECVCGCGEDQLSNPLLVKYDVTFRVPYLSWRTALRGGEGLGEGAARLALSDGTPVETAEGASRED